MGALKNASAVQLILDLPFEEQMSRADFIVGNANRDALGFVEKWPDWPANVALLIGPPGSGKTHLGSIWADRTGARRHHAKNLTFDVIGEWLESGTLLLEGVDLENLDEVALFHLINMVRNGPYALLMTASEPLSRWQLTLPDLASRLRAAIPVEIGAPDDEFMRQILVKHFTDRQIRVEPSLIDYLVLRIERSLGAVRDVAIRLDEASISRGRAITKRFAAEVLGF